MVSLSFMVVAIGVRKFVCRRLSFRVKLNIFFYLRPFCSTGFDGRPFVVCVLEVIGKTRL